MARLAVCLLRHGAYNQPPDVPSAHLPHPLTDEGKVQALQGAELLRDWAQSENFMIKPVIDSSSLLRAWQSAEIIGSALTEALGVTYRIEPYDVLTERSVGSAANLTVPQIEAIIAADPRAQPLPRGWKLDSKFKLPLPGAESLMDAGKRIAVHIKQSVAALKTTSRRDVLKVFVGHGGSFRHAAAFLGALQLDVVPSLSMYHCRPVILEEQSKGSWVQISGD